MRARIKSHALKITSLVKQVTINTITPFVEKPSKEHTLNAEQNENTSTKASLCAQDLFSLFTADIIKEKTLFIR